MTEPVINPEYGAAYVGQTVSFDDVLAQAGLTRKDVSARPASISLLTALGIESGQHVGALPVEPDDSSV